jgi:hypothetical protein
MRSFDRETPDTLTLVVDCGFAAVEFNRSFQPLRTSNQEGTFELQHAVLKPNRREPLALSTAWIPGGSSYYDARRANGF